jgi:acetylornithine/succinyldiaminopimelate/putrescine aminotransferase
VVACNEAGLLTNPLRPNALRLMPPLTVTEKEIDEALEKLDGALTKVAGQ